MYERLDLVVYMRPNYRVLFFLIPAFALAFSSPANGYLGKIKIIKNIGTRKLYRKK